MRPCAWCTADIVHGHCSFCYLQMQFFPLPMLFYLDDHVGLTPGAIYESQNVEAAYNGY
jgi:hypothetical protein